MNVKDLKKGTVYVEKYKSWDYYYIFRITGRYDATRLQVMSNTKGVRFSTDGGKYGNENSDFRLATKEEITWLEACEIKGRVIPNPPINNEEDNLGYYRVIVGKEGSNYSYNTIEGESTAKFGHWMGNEDSPKRIVKALQKGKHHALTRTVIYGMIGDKKVCFDASALEFATKEDYDAQFENKSIEELPEEWYVKVTEKVAKVYNRVFDVSYYKDRIGECLMSHDARNGKHFTCHTGLKNFRLTSVLEKKLPEISEELFLKHYGHYLEEEVVKSNNTPSTMTEYKEFHIGYELKAYTLSDFGVNNFHYYKGSWNYHSSNFVANREIEEIKEVKGRMAGLISGTCHIWLDLDAFHNYLESQGKMPDEEVEPWSVETYLVIVKEGYLGTDYSLTHLDKLPIGTVGKISYSYTRSITAIESNPVANVVFEKDLAKWFATKEEAEAFSRELLSKNSTISLEGRYARVTEELSHIEEYGGFNGLKVGMYLQFYKKENDMEYWGGNGKDKVPYYFGLNCSSDGRLELMPEGFQPSNSIAVGKNSANLQEGKTVQFTDWHAQAMGRGLAIEAVYAIDPCEISSVPSTIELKSKKRKKRISNEVVSFD